MKTWFIILAAFVTLGAAAALGWLYVRLLSRATCSCRKQSAPIPYTSAPWTIQDGSTQYDYLRIWGEGGTRHIGYLNKQYTPEAMARVWADAYLIVSAPLLLEACKEQRATIEIMRLALINGIGNSKTLAGQYQAAMLKADHAIAQAEREHDPDVHA